MVAESEDLTCLWDADILIYRIAFISEDVEQEDIVASRLDLFIQSISEQTMHDDEHFFISDSGNNFRFKLYPEYKAKRAPKPYWLQFLRDYIQSKYKAIIIPRHEADDAVAMYQTENTFIASIDKDLLQIAGAHYNFVKHEWQYVDEWDGLVWFYRQILMGDNTDNVPGLYKIGPKRSAAILAHCTTEKEMWDTVVKRYAEDGIDEDMIIRNAQCMFCYRKPVTEELDGIWLPPNRR